MADLKTNLLGFVMNSPVIGASGDVYKRQALRSAATAFSQKGL